MQRLSWAAVPSGWASLDMTQPRAEGARSTSCSSAMQGPQARWIVEGSKEGAGWGCWGQGTPWGCHCMGDLDPAVGHRVGNLDSAPHPTAPAAVSSRTVGHSCGEGVCRPPRSPSCGLERADDPGQASWLCAILRPVRLGLRGTWGAIAGPDAICPDGSRQHRTRAHLLLEMDFPAASVESARALGRRDSLTRSYVTGVILSVAGAGWLPRETVPRPQGAMPCRPRQGLPPEQSEVWEKWAEACRTQSQCRKELSVSCGDPEAGG